MLFIRGLLVGLSIAATVGPMAILCIRRTLVEGWVAGLVTGMGVATADGFYGAVAGLGLSVVTRFLVGEQGILHALGGLFLLCLGVKTAFAAPATQAATAGGGRFAQTYLAAVGLTLTNPLTILSFAAIFVGVGAGAQSGAVATASLVLGVFLGSSLWWVVLTGVVARVRMRLTPGLLSWLNRLSGTIIAIFGAVALISVL